MSTNPSGDGRMWLVAGIVLFSAAVHVGTLRSQVVALGMLATAAGFVAIALRVQAQTPATGDVSRTQRIVAIGLLAAQGLLVVPFLAGTSATLALVGMGLLVVLLVVAAHLLSLPSPTVAAATWVAVAVGGAILLVAVASRGGIVDVRLFQERGVEVLLAGGDPYAPRIFRDLYPQAASDRFYGPGLSVDGRLQFGFPYFPLGLLLAVPFAVLGDVRWLHVIALLVPAVVAMTWRGGSHSGRLAGLLLLTSPIFAYVVGGGWNDPLVAALLAMLFLAWDRRRDVAADVLLGLLLATKQYAVLFVPIHLALATRARGTGPWRPLVRAGAAFAVVTLPFLVRSGGDMVFSTVVLQFLQPFRPDSLSLLFLLDSTPPRWSALLSPLSAGLALTWVVWRSPGDTAGYARSVTLVLASFLILSKQAFANYYLVVLVGLALILVTWPERTVQGRSVGLPRSTGGRYRPQTRGRLVRPRQGS